MILSVVFVVEQIPLALIELNLVIFGVVNLVIALFRVLRYRNLELGRSVRHSHARSSVGQACAELLVGLVVFGGSYARSKLTKTSKKKELALQRVSRARHHQFSGDLRRLRTVGFC
jgi:hypothetical protein